MSQNGASSSWGCDLQVQTSWKRTSIFEPVFPKMLRSTLLGLNQAMCLPGAITDANSDCCSLIDQSCVPYPPWAWRGLHLNHTNWEWGDAMTEIG